MSNKLRLNGHAVRAIRERSGIRQSALALSLGISRAYMANVESGRKAPGGDLAFRVAEQLNVPLAAIAFTEEEKPAA